MHWGASKHPSKDRLCKDLGVIKQANAPVCFTPNVHAVKWVDSQAFHQMSSLISGFSASESRIFISMFRQQARIKRAGFSFLDRVYIRVGSNYLANYFAGHILGVAPEGELLIVGSDFLARQKNAVVLQILPSSILTEEQFQVEKDRLISSGRIDAERPRNSQPTVHSDYEAPTIETSPELLESLAKKAKKSRSKSPQPLRVLEVDLSDL